MSPSEPREPGAQFLAEIREQPRALERLLEREADFARVAAIARERGNHSIPIPMPSVPLLAPILSVVPGQLFAWALARAKGLDPDVPRGLSKVTLAL